MDGLSSKTAKEADKGLQVGNKRSEAGTLRGYVSDKQAENLLVMAMV